jgi:hypothetical protein
MKRLEWKKVDSEALEGTIWPELKDDQVKLDVEYLVNKFQEIVIVKKDAGGGGAADANKEVHIVDGNRQQNVGMGLKALRRKGFTSGSGWEVVQALISLDETRISLDVAKQLSEMAPKAEEIKELRAYDGDLKNLGEVDSFLYELTNIPRLENRLKSIIVKYTFDEGAGLVRDKLKIVRDACTEVSKSKTLKQLMEIVLAVGNYLNGATPRGQAWGFRLELLEKLENNKDKDNKTTLVDYIVHVLELYYPKVLDEFKVPNCELCTTISLSEVKADMDDLKKKVALVKGELSAGVVDKSDKFPQVFSTFQLKASKTVQELEIDFEMVKEDFIKLGKRYSEPETGLEPNTMFPYFAKFHHALVKSHDALTQARLKEEKLRKLEEEKRKHLTLKENSSGDLGIGDAFKKTMQGDAKTIAKNLRENAVRQTVEGDDN